MKSYLIGPAGKRICITTNVPLSSEGSSQQTLPPPRQPDQVSSQKHYILYPGRADHALKYGPFMEKFAKRGEFVWCVDPFGQGATDGGWPCELYDKADPKPCCARKGHGTWDAYSATYLKALQAIFTCLSSQVQGKQGGADIPSKPQIVLVAHSMAANVDMWTRLDKEKAAQLNAILSEIHYIAPMVAHTLFLRDKVGIWGEEAVRHVLAALAAALTLLGRGTRDLIVGGGPINPFELTPEVISDKIHPQHRETFIGICQSNPAFEIGMVTNQWFWEAHKACRKIRNITPQAYFPAGITVHVPGADQIVYPERVMDFFKAHLPNAHSFHIYEDEPHSLFWGSEAAVNRLVDQVVGGGAESLVLKNSF